ncbi:MAG: peptidase ADAM/reprolysin [Flavipsychrobacter sp.]|jgi:hypothetical protein|nr:peptidase ADAM/reprolysin [Flavipsychrobacter sp.]
MKRFLLCLVLVVALAPIKKVAAKDNTPIETFIQQVKQTNKFIPVNYLWQADNNFDKTDLLQNVEDAQPLTIDYSQVAVFLQKKMTAISLEIPALKGGSYTIELARYEFTTNDFQIHTLGENGKDELFDYTPGLYYRGIVKGYPGSVAAFSFFKNEVYGIFSIPGEGNYTVVPNTMVGTYFDYNTHYLLYNDNDLKIKQFAPKCEADMLPEFEDLVGAKTTTTLNNKVYQNCTEVRVFEVGDYALYQTKGNSATNVTNFLTALFNNQATIYRNELIPIVLKYVQVNTATDNYQKITVSSSSRHLDTFGKVTKNNLHGCDLALLMSTHLNGGYGALGGVAWLKSMCASYNSSSHYGPYGFCNVSNSGVINFPTYTWNVEVAAHEMGHIVGSPHTHRCCWNPPGTGTTAIDGCQTIEGGCPDPGNPSSGIGGTIMSYCHLTSTGINFSNGFGPQPGDTIRRFIKNKVSSTCQAKYIPAPVMAKSGKTLAASRECTDLVSGVATTYYWWDNNTADHADDTLVLMVKPNGNNIGNLNKVGFTVTTGTQPGYASGRADTIIFPSGTAGVGGKNMAMQRYWKVTGATVASSAVEVIFPFLSQDTIDVNGSVPGDAAVSSYRMYTVKNPVDPSPAGNFAGSVPANFTIYTNGATASATNWSLSMSGTTYRAHMMMTDLSVGGSGFYPTAIGVGTRNQQLTTEDVNIYPNPASGAITVDASGFTITGVQVIDLQGRLVASVTDAAVAVTMPVNELANGMYFVRVQTEDGAMLTKKITVMK